MADSDFTWSKFNSDELKKHVEDGIKLRKTYSDKLRKAEEEGTNIRLIEYLKGFISGLDYFIGSNENNEYDS